MPLVYCNVGNRSVHITYSDALRKYVIEEVAHDIIQPLPDVYPCLADYYMNPLSVDFTQVLNQYVERGIYKANINLDYVVRTYLDLFNDESLQFRPNC